MANAILLGRLGQEVTDPEEESFLLFCQSIPSQNLGFVDRTASTLELTVAGKDVMIYQSPAVLVSSRQGGTTGAVVWKITPHFANWIASPQNVLFNTNALSASSTVVELGCGVSGLNATALAPMIGYYIATDQDYVLKLLKQNISENIPSRKGKNLTTKSNITATSLDWELNVIDDDILSTIHPHANRPTYSPGIDAIIACDCIYNDTLIAPLVSTFASLCHVQASSRTYPTLCIVAQQLRSSDVFEAWMKAFHMQFRVWRLPDALLTPELGEGSGYVVHVGVLREQSVS
ncbi:MAG: hypothetical protein M1833_004027 [Piccolia ochrophora]|nr:MAG: hypothetical protein M1833_004027 [Piccolia ochrophora]